MRRSFIIAAVFAFASIARAQDPGVALKSFDQKHAGSEKMHMLGHVVGHPAKFTVSASISHGCSM